MSKKVSLVFGLLTCCVGFASHASHPIPPSPNFIYNTYCNIPWAYDARHHNWYQDRSKVYFGASAYITPTDYSFYAFVKSTFRYNTNRGNPANDVPLGSAEDNSNYRMAQAMKSVNPTPTDFQNDTQGRFRYISDNEYSMKIVYHNILYNWSGPFTNTTSCY